MVLFFIFIFASLKIQVVYLSAKFRLCRTFANRISLLQCNWRKIPQKNMLAYQYIKEMIFRFFLKIFLSYHLSIKKDTTIIILRNFKLKKFSVKNIVSFLEHFKNTFIEDIKKSLYDQKKFTLL